MKFIAAVCLMFALVAVALGLKDPICGLPAGIDGNGLIKCAAFIPSFSYHPETNSCEKFIYGGCGGNENRFGTQELCEQKCKE
uniref:Immune induced molecule 33, isoform A n=1 Tax=Drosophila melanogaster TaxID=7227 RepID=Q9VQT8_DROME|eukprot:NP_001285594.1 immune induced molecule 33, isoform B [Drosophila melanogaster]